MEDVAVGFGLWGVVVLGLLLWIIIGGNKSLVAKKETFTKWPPEVGDKYTDYVPHCQTGGTITKVGSVSESGAWVNVRTHWICTNALKRDPETGRVWEERTNIGENEALL